MIEIDFADISDVMFFLEYSKGENFFLFDIAGFAAEAEFYLPYSRDRDDIVSTGNIANEKWIVSQYEKIMGYEWVDVTLSSTAGREYSLEGDLWDLAEAMSKYMDTIDGVTFEWKDPLRD